MKRGGARARARDDPRFRRFVRLFDRGEYFEAHEVLEEVWLEASGEEKQFLQALIQIAVALEHAARGNRRGAEALLHRAKRRLEPIGWRREGIDARRLARGAEAYLEGSDRERPRIEDVKDRVRSGENSGPTARGIEPSIDRKPRSGTRVKTAKPRKPTKKKTSVRAVRRVKKERTRLSPKGAVRPAPSRGRARFKLDPLETRRARAAAILEGLEKLYPGARCELTHASALQLLVATILSAQCTDVRVNMTTPQLFARYPDAKSFAGADLEEVGRLVKSTGFFRNKAKSIVALGKALVEKHRGEVPSSMEELVELPGVGRKTANVILAEWFGKPGIAVDTHVIRLTGPVWRLTDATDPVKIEFALYEVVPESRRSFFGLATILHGRRICSARSPNCPACPLAGICPTAFQWPGTARRMAMGGSL